MHSKKDSRKIRRGDGWTCAAFICSLREYEWQIRRCHLLGTSPVAPFAARLLFGSGDTYRASGRFRLPAMVRQLVAAACLNCRVAHRQPALDAKPDVESPLPQADGLARTLSVRLLARSANSVTLGFETVKTTSQRVGAGRNPPPWQEARRRFCSKRCTDKTKALCQARKRHSGADYPVGNARKIGVRNPQKPGHGFCDG
jgi:hypothetical protein